MIFHPNQKYKKGFTFVEILVTIAIIVIILSIAVPNLIQYQINYEMLSLNDKARVIFLAAQNHLITVKNTGELPALTQDLPGLTDADIDAASRPDDWNENRDNLVYLQLNQDGTGDVALREMLKPYIQDIEILNKNITLEFNKKTGMVASVIYSERANSLAYQGIEGPSGDGVNISLRTKTALWANRLGFYGNADTGSVPDNIQKPTVNIENDDQLRVVWTDCEPSGSTNPSLGDNIIYTVKIMSSDGAVTYLELSGIQRSDLTLSPINSEIENDVTDLTAVGTPEPGATHTLIYQDGKFSLILDKIDTIHNDILFGQSIFYRYPSIPVGEFMARVEASAAGSPAKHGDSPVSHTYFAEEDDDGIYKIAYARHLSNMRYLNTEGSSFEQIQEIDWDNVAIRYGSNDCPESFTPVSHHYRDMGNNFVANNLFAGAYQGNHFALQNFVIQDATGSPAGLFRVLDGENAVLSNMSLDSFTVEAEDTAGILAGEISTQDTGINNVEGCTLANSSLTVTLDAGTEALAGGLVGHNEGCIVQSSVTGCTLDFQGEDVANTVLGGVVGRNDNEMEEVSAEDITVSGYSYVGGFAGFNAGDISACSVENGSVGYLGYYSGGFAGSSQGSITESEVRNTVVAPRTGVVPAPGGIGGFVGLSSGVLSRSYVFDSHITLLNGSSLGGFVGSTSSALTDCYVSATLVTGTGSVYVGGFAGSNSGSILRAYVNHKYLTGSVYSPSVLGGTWVGGFAGSNSGSIAESYNNAIVSASNGTPAGLVALNSGFLLRSHFLTGIDYNTTVSDSDLGESFDFMTGAALTDVFNDPGQWLFDPGNAEPSDYPYPTLAGLMHYGEWPEAADESSIPAGRYFAYYEIYTDGTLGIYGTRDNASFVDTLSSTKIVVQEGYGVVFAGEPSPAVSTVSIKIDSSTALIARASFLTVGNHAIAPLTYDFMQNHWPGNSQFSHAIVSIDGTELVRQTRCNLLFAAALGPNTSWHIGGSSDNPYQVRSPRHLLNIGYYHYLSSYFSQTTNIDYAEYAKSKISTEVDPYYHNPIGNFYWGWDYFEGEYNGNENDIAHLTIQSSDPLNSGLFARVGFGGVLKNIRLSDTDLDIDLGWGMSYNSVAGFGALAGYISSSSRVENCGVIGGTIDQTIWDDFYSVRLGGLVGNNYGIISNSFATCTIHGKGSACGGLVGDNNYGATITKSYANAPGIIIQNGSGEYAGGFAGWNEGSIADCYSVSSLSATDYSGGFVGINTNGGEIETCYSLGRITEDDPWYVEVGGFAGENSWNASIINSYFLQDNDYNESLSGIGYNGNAGSSVLPRNFFELSFLSSTSYPGFDFTNTWGAATEDDTFPIDAALSGKRYPYAWIKNVPHYGDWPVSDIVGQLAYFEIYEDSTGGASFLQSGTMQNILDNDKTVAQEGYGVLVDGSFADASNAVVKVYDGNGVDLLLEVSGVALQSLSTSISVVRLSNEPWLSDLPVSSTDFYVAECFLNGVSAGRIKFNPYFAGALMAESESWDWGTQSNPYAVRTPYQLRNIGLSSYLAKYFQQTADISYAVYTAVGGAEYHTAIGTQASPFAGQYDGGEKTISGLVMDIGHDYGGLFGYTTGILQNIRLTDGEDAAILPTDGNASYGKTGSLAGYNSGTIENCVSAVPVTAHDTVGGLVGWNTGSIIGSAASGNVLGTNDDVGGLVGKNQGIIQTSHATGTVTGNGNTGGLTGYMASGSQISQCYATGAVTADAAAGGLVGNGVSGVSISQCYAVGDVSGNASIGGFFGDNHGYSVSNCYATGVVTQVISGQAASVNFGGFGGNAQSAAITKCYAAGKVIATASDSVGGFLGYGNSASVTSCYFLGNGNTLYNYTSKQAPFRLVGNFSSTTGVLSVIQMNRSRSFSGWDFDSVWEMNTNDSSPTGYPYPKLKGLTHFGAWPTAT